MGDQVGMGVEVQLYVIGYVGGYGQYVFYCVVQFGIDYVVVGVGVECWVMYCFGYCLCEFGYVVMYGDCGWQVLGDFFGE